MKDSETVYNSLFTLMVRSDDEEDDVVTPFNINQNLNDYTPKK